MKKLPLALSLVASLSGCHTWYAINPSSLDDLAASRELRVGEREEAQERYVRTHRVTDHYARPEVGENGMITLRGHVVSYHLTQEPPRRRGQSPRRRVQTVSSSVTYDPARTTVLARRAHVGRIVAASIIFSLIAGGAATTAYLTTR